ncbi:MAG: hypothetical protein U0841_15155 [Chloroflexia bacterium]
MEPVEARRPLQQRLVDLPRVIRGGEHQNPLVAPEAVEFVQKNGAVVLAHQPVDILEREDARGQLPGTLQKIAFTASSALRLA